MPGDPGINGTDGEPGRRGPPGKDVSGFSVYKCIVTQGLFQCPVWHMRQNYSHKIWLDLWSIMLLVSSNSQGNQGPKGQRGPPGTIGRTGKPVSLDYKYYSATLKFSAMMMIHFEFLCLQPSCFFFSVVWFAMQCDMYQSHFPLCPS